MTTPSYLPEVPEGEAVGLVAELYDDIRQVVGLPLVNLVYRHLALEPRRLQETWRQIRPNLTDEVAGKGAEALAVAASIDVPALAPAAVRVLRLAPADLEAAAATIDAYNDANPRNLIALLALLRGVPGTGDSRPASRDPTPRELLPMASLSSLDEPVRALIEEMAGAVATRGDQTVVPSLFRHLAQHPTLLALAWTAVRPAIQGRAIARQANVVARQAAALAAALPHRVEAMRDPETVAVLRQFTGTIPRMVVVGVALRSALREP